LLDPKLPFVRLFDDLVGAGEDRGRHGQAERLGGLEIDDQLECGWLLDRQIRELLALEDPSGVNAELATDSLETRCIADQAADRGELAKPVDRRNGMACRQRHELLAPA
jgi:hypothetical protein